MKPRFRRRSIVLVDDHIFLRKGLERVLNDTDEFVVCEGVGTAAEGLDAVRELQPDGAIVDVGLPDTDGIELTKQLVTEFPELIVIVLSMHEEPEYAERALQAGARAYILKNQASETLEKALRDAFEGKRLFSTTLDRPTGN